VRQKHDAIGVLIGLLKAVRRKDDGLAVRRESAHRVPKLVA
jgi:hypothetical protein